MLRAMRSRFENGSFKVGPRLVASFGSRASSRVPGDGLGSVLGDLVRSSRHVRPVLPWIVALCGVVVLVAVLVALPFGEGGAWIGEKAHGLGHALDHSVASVARGDGGAWAALLGGSALYGFLHALGPGHGKVLVGGVGAGSSVTARRLMALSLVASLAQALWAITLVYGALLILGLSIEAVTGLARDVLAPLGALLIAGIGALMLWRTCMPIMQRRRGERSSVFAPRTCTHDHQDDHEGEHDRETHGHHRCGHDHHDHAPIGRHGHYHHDHDCSCAHAPTLDAVARLERPWDAVTLVAGIAVRPCTSALIVLALAWQADVPLAGALAALAMGLGTAALVCLIAGSSVLVRRMALLVSAGPAVRAHLALRIAAGTMLLLLGAAMLSGPIA